MLLKHINIGEQHRKINLIFQFYIATVWSGVFCGLLYSMGTLLYSMGTVAWHVLVIVTVLTFLVRFAYTLTPLKIEFLTEFLFWCCAIFNYLLSVYVPYRISILALCNIQPITYCLFAMNQDTFVFLFVVACLLFPDYLSVC